MKDKWLIGAIAFMILKTAFVGCLFWLLLGK